LVSGDTWKVATRRQPSNFHGRVDFCVDSL